MVFQDYALFPHMDVTANIAYPLRIQKVPRSRREAAAAEVAGRLSLSELLRRRPGQLSGGQQQRVALARAIACRPKVFLFDEPLSNLDARLRLEARTFLKRLQGELGVTTVFVTHDQGEALALAHRVAVMDAGRITQVGAPAEIFHRPATTFVASFIGSTPMNLLPGKVAGDALHVAGAVLPAPPGLPDGEEIVYGVRPEYADLSAAPATTPSPEPSPSWRTSAPPPWSRWRAAGTTATCSSRWSSPRGGAPAGTAAWAVPRPGRALIYHGDRLIHPA
nr:hypothetical protein GCM10020093_026280 [Planobispora longispora]